MTKLSRRNFLRGSSGALMALPFLESMTAATKKTSKPVQRLAFYYVPIGVVRSGFFPGEAKIAIPKFSGANTKAVEGAKLPMGWQNWDFTPPTLKPLQKIEKRITFVTGLDRTFQDGTDVHAQCGCCYLSSAAPYDVKSSAWPLDRTLDHIIADKIGQETPFKTLEFSCNSHKDNKESIYFDNISWYGTGHLAPSIRDPKIAYNRLFKTTGQKGSKEITDLVLADANYLKSQLSYHDRAKFEEYYEAIRAIELQIERLNKMRSKLSKVKLNAPVDSHMPRRKYINLMGDMMIVALQTGLTNVATLMVGPERWDTPYTYDSLFKKPMSHHQMSHNQNKFIKQLQQVDQMHMEVFVNLVSKMDSIKEANGTTLLDNTLFTYGSGLGDGATHQYNDLPIIVAGSGGKKFKTGKHFHCKDGTPLANLWLTQAQAMGVKLKRFADSSSNIAPLLT